LGEGSKVKDPSRVERVEIREREPIFPGDKTAFLELTRLNVVNHYSDGTKSRLYAYDTVIRKWIDAVVLVLTTRQGGHTAVCLRAGVRPPLLLRPELALPLPDEQTFHTLWELPAGLIEDEDRGRAGLLARAVAETLEETGYRLSADDFSTMPGAPFLSPGVLPERLHFLRAEITNIKDRTRPEGDGSPVEEGAGIWWVSLEKAIAMCETGDIADTKTELALRRLAMEETR
jgi:ADP-ribose pyrophosphatase